MTDTLSAILCPACKSEMKKVFISKEGFTVDVCLDGCGGFFFDTREFKALDEENENVQEIIDALKGKTFKKVDESNKRVCPSCGASMVKNFSSILKEVQVDDCYSCGGKFLDMDELLKIRAEYKTEDERSAAVSDFLNTTPEGQEAKDLALAVQRQHVNRSLFKKLFDKAAGIG